jgi:uncharacterized protein (DUF169 family)
MQPNQLDFSILDKCNFKYAPVAVKFFPEKPEGIERLDKRIAWCQMLTEAQQGQAFYKKCLLNTTQLAGWMKTGSPKARKHDIRWA